jgi:hypothetical protein
MTFNKVGFVVSNGHSPQIGENGELLVQICQGESHFSWKWLLASVSESGESAQHCSSTVGEYGESAQHGSVNVGESGESVQHGSAQARMIRSVVLSKNNIIYMHKMV